MAKRLETKLTNSPDPTNPTDVANKRYVDSLAVIPFWNAADLQQCIATDTGFIPFWDENNNPSNIPLGCP